MNKKTGHFVIRYYKKLLHIQISSTSSIPYSIFHALNSISEKKQSIPAGKGPPAPLNLGYKAPSKNLPQLPVTAWNFPPLQPSSAAYRDPYYDILERAMWYRSVSPGQVELAETADPRRSFAGAAGSCGRAKFSRLYNRPAPGVSRNRSIWSLGRAPGDCLSSCGRLFADMGYAGRTREFVELTEGIVRVIVVVASWGIVGDEVWGISQGLVRALMNFPSQERDLD